MRANPISSILGKRLYIILLLGVCSVLMGYGQCNEASPCVQGPFQGPCLDVGVYPTLYCTNPSIRAEFSIPSAIDYCEGDTVIVLNQTDLITSAQWLDSIAYFIWNWSDDASNCDSMSCLDTAFHVYIIDDDDITDFECTTGKKFVPVGLIAVDCEGCYSHSQKSSASLFFKPRAEFVMPVEACLGDCLTITEDRTCPDPDLPSIISVWNVYSPDTIGEWTIDTTYLDATYYDYMPDSICFDTIGEWTIELIVQQTAVPACANLIDTFLQTVTIIPYPIINLEVTTGDSLIYPDISIIPMSYQVCQYDEVCIINDSSLYWTHICIDNITLDGVPSGVSFDGLGSDNSCYCYDGTYCVNPGDCYYTEGDPIINPDPQPNGCEPPPRPDTICFKLDTAGTYQFDMTLSNQLKCDSTRTFAIVVLADADCPISIFDRCISQPSFNPGNFICSESELASVNYEIDLSYLTSTGGTQPVANWSNTYPSSVVLNEYGQYYLEISTSGCSDTSFIDSFYFIPLITITSPTDTFCDNSNICIDLDNFINQFDTLSGFCLQWDQSIDAVTGSCYSPMTAGAGTDTIYLSSCDLDVCMDSIYVVINVAALDPQLPDTSICITADSIDLDAYFNQPANWTLNGDPIIWFDPAQGLGNYTFLYSSSAGAICTFMNSSVTITVVDTFSVNIVASKDTTCINKDLEFSFTLDGTVNDTSVLWDFGDGFTSTDVEVTHSYIAIGEYPVTVTISQPGGGCSDSAIRSVVILDSEVLSFAHSEIGMACSDYSLVLSVIGPENYLTYSWNIMYGDTTYGPYTGSTDTIDVPTSASSATITLSAVNAYGCDPDSITMTHIFGTVDPSPNPSDTTVCRISSPFNLDDYLSSGGNLFVADWQGQGVTGGNMFDPTLAGAGTVWIIYDSTATSGCPFIDSFRITVVETFSVNMVVSKDTTCINQDLEFSFTLDGTVNDTSVLWDFGDGFTSTDVEATHSYISIGEYPVTVTITQPGGGCSDSAMRSVVILASEELLFAHSEVGMACSDYSLVLSVIDPKIYLTYSWNIMYGDTTYGPYTGSTDTIDVPTSASSATITLSAVNAYGCDPDSITMTHFFGTVDPSPNPSDTTVCRISSPFNLDDYLSSGGNLFVADWQGPGVTGGNMFDPTTLAEAGTFWINYDSTGTTGCPFIDSFRIVVRDTFNISILPSSDTACVEDAIIFSFSTTPTLSPPGLVYWDFGVEAIITDTSTLLNPVFTYSDTGTFTVSLVVADGPFGCMDTNTITIMILEAPPEPDFDFNIPDACDTTFLSLGVTNPDPNTTYVWSILDEDLGSPIGATGDTVEITLLSSPLPRNVVITLSTDHLCGASAIDSTIEIPAGFSAGISYNDERIKCPTDTVRFSNKNVLADSFYVVYDVYGVTGNGPDTSYNVLVDMPFSNPEDIDDTIIDVTVIMYAFNSMCSPDTMVITIPVYPNIPVASAQYSQVPVCAGDIVWFYNESSDFATEVQIDFADGLSSNQFFDSTDTLFHVYSEGTFHPLAIAFGCGIDTFFLQPITVNSGPEFELEVSEPLCLGETITVSNVGLVNQPVWTFIDAPFPCDSALVDTFSGSFVATCPGSYTVVLHAQAGTPTFCPGSDTITFTVHESPDLSVVASPVIGCAPLAVNVAVIAPEPSITYLIDCGDTIITGTAYTCVYDAIGSYTIGITAITDESCISDTAIDILVHDLMVNVFTSDNFICVGEEVCFANFTDFATDVLMDFGDSTLTEIFGPTDTICHTYDTAGVFVPTVIAIANCGTISKELDPVTVNPKPEIDITISDDGLYCLGNTVTITNHTVVSTPVWTVLIDSLPDVIIPNTNSISYTFYAAGVHTFVFEASSLLNGFCPNSDSITIEVSENPMFDISVSPETGCAPIEITISLNESGPQSTNLINCGNTQIFQGNQGSCQFDTAGTYSINIISTADTGRCVTDTTFDIIILEKFVVEAFGESPILIGDPSELDFDLPNGHSFIEYSWCIGDSIINGVNPGRPLLVWPLVPTTYTPKVSSADSNCYGSDEVFIDVICDEIFMPDNFSPNGDGVNDLYTVYRIHLPNDVNHNESCILELLELSIYDRWGERIYYQEGFDYSIGWDGTFKGTELYSGMYTAIARYLRRNGDVEQLRKEIKLVRQ